MTTRKPIDWTFDGHPIYAPTVDLPLPRYPASVAEHLDAARERMQAANVPTLEQISESITPVTGPEVLGKVITHSPAGEAVARSGRARQIAVEYAAGDDSAPVVGVHVWSLE